MNDSEIARLEEQLQLKLPAEYVEFVRRLARELKGLKGTCRAGVRYPLICGGSYLLSMNLAEWGRSRRKDWPVGFLLCGYERTLKYLIDTREASPRVWQLREGSKKPEPCASYPNLPALYEYALRTFREFDAKEKRKRGKDQRTTPAPAPGAPTPPDKPSATPPTVDPRLAEEMVALARAAGFELVKPQRKHTIELLIADLLPAFPADLQALYTICDGGRCDRYGLRILPLAEAAELAKVFFHGWPTTGLFPFVQGEHFSAECSVCLRGPFAGYVLAIYEGHFEAILTRSLHAFLDILAKNLAAVACDFEGVLFGKLPPDHVPFELVGDERTADDLRRAREMLQRAEDRYRTHDVRDDEYRTLFKMAWNLLSAEQAGEIIPLLKHEDGFVRRDAEIHLHGIRTPEVAEAFEAMHPELPSYIEDAVRVLQKEGLDAHQVHRVWIRIDPAGAWIGPVNCRFETRVSADNWEWFVRWANSLVSR